MKLSSDSPHENSPVDPDSELDNGSASVTTRRAWNELTKSETAEDDDDDPEGNRKKRMTSEATNKRMIASVNELNAAEQEEEEDSKRNGAVADENGIVRKKKGRPKKLDNSVMLERNVKIASSIVGLDALHDVTLKYIEGNFTVCLI